MPHPCSTQEGEAKEAAGDGEKQAAAAGEEAKKEEAPHPRKKIRVSALWLYFLFVCGRVGGWVVEGGDQEGGGAAPPQEDPGGCCGAAAFLGGVLARD